MLLQDLKHFFWGGAVFLLFSFIHNPNNVSFFSIFVCFSFGKVLKGVLFKRQILSIASLPSIQILLVWSLTRTSSSGSWWYELICLSEITWVRKHPPSLVALFFLLSENVYAFESKRSVTSSTGDWASKPELLSHTYKFVSFNNVIRPVHV